MRRTADRESRDGESENIAAAPLQGRVRKNSGIDSSEEGLGRIFDWTMALFFIFGIASVASFDFSMVLIGMMILSLCSIFIYGETDRIIKHRSNRVSKSLSSWNRGFLSQFQLALLVAISGLCMIVGGGYCILVETAPELVPDYCSWDNGIGRVISGVIFILYGISTVLISGRVYANEKGHCYPDISYLPFLFFLAMTPLSLIFIPFGFFGFFTEDIASYRIPILLVAVIGLSMSTWILSFTFRDVRYPDDLCKWRRIDELTIRCYLAESCFGLYLVVTAIVVPFLALEGVFVDMLVIVGLIITGVVMRKFPNNIRKSTISTKSVPYEVYSCSECEIPVRYIEQYQRYWCDDCYRYTRPVLSYTILREKITYTLPPVFSWLIMKRFSHTYDLHHERSRW